MFLTKIKKLLTHKSRQRKISEAKAKRLYDKASCFVQEITESKFEKATQILKQYPNIVSHKLVIQSHVMRHLAKSLSLPNANNLSRQLYLDLHKAGLQSSPTDIALMIKQPENMSLIQYLYQTQSNLKRAVEFVKPLHKLALSLTKPQTNNQNAKMFVCLHEIGLRAKSEDIALLFQNRQNISIIQYVFLAQPELRPGINKQYDQQYAHAALIGKNIIGLKFLYLSGAYLSHKQQHISGLSTDLDSRIYRQRMILQNQYSNQRSD